MSADPEDVVHRLLLQSIAERQLLTSAAWAAHIDHLCDELVHLQTDVGTTLSAVVRASAVMQELLLDLAVLPQTFTIPDILQVAARLLDDLYNEDAVVYRGAPQFAAHQSRAR